MFRVQLLAALVMLVVSTVAGFLGGRYGAAVDEVRAMEIARGEFSRRGRVIDGPLKVTLTNGVWRVMGRYPTGRTGEVYVRQRDGRVPSINPRRLQLVPVVEKPMQPLSSPVRPRPQSADSMPSSFTRKISTLFGGMGPAPRSP